MRGTAIVLTFVASGCTTDLDAPQEQVVATEQGAVFFVEADADAVYWSGDLGVRRMTRDGGDVRWIGEGAPSLAMAVDGERVYWATADRVVWSSVEGGEVHEIATGQRCVFAMATDGEQLFWASVIDGTVWSWDVDTGRIRAIAHEQSNPTSIAVDDGRVYWATGDGRVTSTLTDGTEPRMLAADLPWLSALAVDDGVVYAASYDGTIRAVSRDGGVVELIEGGALSSFAGGLAADRGDLYWVAGDVRVLAHDASSVDTIGRGVATALAVDAGGVYWATAAGDIVAHTKGHLDAY